MKQTIETLLSTKVINPSFTVRAADRKAAFKVMKDMLASHKLRKIEDNNRFYYRCLQYQEAYRDLTTDEAYNLKSLFY